jgi:hypothetical protein
MAFSSPKFKGVLFQKTGGNEREKIKERSNFLNMYNATLNNIKCTKACSFYDYDPMILVHYIKSVHNEQNEEKLAKN